MDSGYGTEPFLDFNKAGIDKKGKYKKHKIINEIIVQVLFGMQDSELYLIIRTQNRAKPTEKPNRLFRFYSLWQYAKSTDPKTGRQIGGDILEELEL